MSILQMLLNNSWYVLAIAGIMVMAGYGTHYNILDKIYNKLSKIIKSKRILLTLLSTIGGVLPIKGRVIASAGIFDLLLKKDTNSPLRPKFGILNYIASHHYYMWSVLEKTIIVPMAVFNIGYLQVMGYTWPLLMTSLLMLFGYIFYGLRNIDDEHFVLSSENITKKTKKVPLPYNFIKWNVLGFIYGVIVLSNIIRSYGSYFTDLVETFSGSFITASVFTFIVSVILGSSGQIAGIVSLITTLFGVQYFTYFMALGFAGYLISPIGHRCNIISMKYFQTPVMEYARAIGLWAILIILTGIISLFFV